ncbi:histone-lysine n-methyltransferase atxr3 [Hordeum vulgare]|nr:histone-lysine n-methyltransferase atxr3 [Hordeum vulgare]
MRGLTPTPSSSSPSPPHMTEEEEAQLIQRVMEDSMSTYVERQWVGLEDALALSATSDVAILEEQPVAVKEEVREAPDAFRPELVGQCWTWWCTTTEMAHSVAVPWCPTPPRSPERKPSPRVKVVHAPPAPPTFQGPSAYLWTMPPYVDLTGDDDNNDDT